MKKIFVTDLNKEDDITDLFMVKKCTIRADKNGRRYIDYTLGDKSGEINAKKYNVEDVELDRLSGHKLTEVGKVISVKARVTEYNGTNQLNITRIRLPESDDDIDFNDYIKSAPQKPEDMYDFIWNRVEEIQDNELKALCQRILDDNREKLLYYPAASKNHHSVRSGLLWHMVQMLKAAIAMCSVYEYLNKDLLVSGVILHDIEKIREIQSDINGVSSGYTPEGNLLGHLVLGVRELEKLCIEMGIDREKSMMLEHMILSHHYEPEWGSPIRPQFPEAEVLHYLDIIDARLYDMRDAVSNVELGNFSEKVWTLDNRRIYKPICYIDE